MVVITTRKGNREKLVFETIAELVTWLKQGKGECIRWEAICQIKEE